MLQTPQLWKTGLFDKLFHTPLSHVKFIYGLFNDVANKSISGRRVRRLVNHELEWMWKEVIMAHIQAFTRHMLSGGGGGG
jgi:hypothetical protein